MLESKESHDVARRDSRIAEFQKAGIRIAQDDLGSGHSSLLRMDRVPCDRVKIDQGLVRGTLKRPVRALEFIYHLTLLAQGFGAPVTVEGLEDIGLIEAAAILGADHGQGYGISKPMRTQDVMSLEPDLDLPIDAEIPARLSVPWRVICSGSQAGHAVGLAGTRRQFHQGTLARPSLSRSRREH